VCSSDLGTFKEFLFTEWEIPVLSQLYKYFTGSSLGIRPIDIAAYVITVPVTLVYKLSTGAAPFPDQAALDAYENYYTADWLKSKLGLGTEVAVTVDLAQETFIKKFSLGCYAGGMFVRIVTDSITGALSSNLAGNKIASYSSIVLRFFTTASSTPWALVPGSGAPGCPAGTKGFGVVIWICQLFCGPVRGLLIASLWKVKAAGGEGEPLVGDAEQAANKAKIYTSEITLTVWGAVHLIMSIWNYVDTPKADKNTTAFTRGLSNVIPGQFTRFLFLGPQEEIYFIPAAIGIVFNGVGYTVSAASAIIELADG